MSFGFSVGDFLAVGKLVADVISSLNDTHGSKSEYQALIIELECFEKALVRLDTISTDQPSTSLDSIKYAALSCRQPLEDFLRKVRKYERSLGIQAKEKQVRSAVDKIKFAFWQKENVQRFQSYIHVHVGTINVLLAEHGLEKVDTLAKKAESDKKEIVGRLEDNQNFLSTLKNNVSFQLMAAFRAESLLNRLFRMINGDIRSSLASLESMVAKACTASQQIYSVLLELKLHAIAVDPRWSFFQTPTLFEDALGRRLPVPSEYDLDLLHAIIKQRFRHGPGAHEVDKGYYELLNANKRDEALRPGAALVPGSSITMAIILPQVIDSSLEDKACVMPQCNSRKTVHATWGGQICCECGVWFDKSIDKEPVSSIEVEKVAQLLADAGSSDLKLRTALRVRPMVFNDAIQIPDWGIGSTRVHSTESPMEGVSMGFGWENFRNVRYHPQNIISSSPDAIDSLWRAIIMQCHQQEGDFSFGTFSVLDDAYFYLDRVKDTTLHTSAAMYARFLFIMRGYKETWEVKVTLRRVLELFWDEPDLVKGFTRFLPWYMVQHESGCPGCNVRYARTIDEGSDYSSETTSDASSYGDYDECSEFDFGDNSYTKVRTDLNDDNGDQHYVDLDEDGGNNSADDSDLYEDAKEDLEYDIEIERQITRLDLGSS